MKSIGVAIATLALLVAAPAIAETTSSSCAIARPADDDLKAFAAHFFSTADAADIDALLTCLSDPDPDVRDRLAFTLWSAGLRGKHLSPALMRHGGARLIEILHDPDDAASFRRPFAALALAEVARVDRVEAFLTDAERHRFAETGAAYLRAVSDYRGFVAGEGWRHGVAHGADLMLQLALNPHLSRTDADLLLGAIAAQVAPAASPYYHHGEPGRLARPVLFLAKRADIDDAAWAAWFHRLHPDASPRWTDAYSSDAGLAAVHNSNAFAQALYVGASETQDPQVRRLAPLAVEMIRALP